MDEDEDFLKRFYMYSEYDNKIILLSEYYKYHNDMPRLFMKPTYKTVFKYHEKVRRVEYYKIMENNNNNNNHDNHDNSN